MLYPVKRFFAWMGLALYLVLTFSGGHEMVLCHEQDGRVSLERAINGICSDSLEGVPSKSAGMKACAANRHCVDQPVSMASLSSRGMADKMNADAHLVALSPLQPLRLHVKTVTAYPLSPQPPPRRPERHRYLASIVLLI